MDPALSLQLLNAANRPEVAKAAKTLATKMIDERFPYYSAYYAAQAAHHLDDAAWNAIAKPILDRIITSQ